MPEASGTLPRLICGVYIIRNTLNGRIYVGSASDVRRRWNGHRYHLRRGTHHSPKLQASWRKHGSHFFSFEVIEAVADELLLLAREQHWIDSTGAFLTGYNCLPTAGNTRGYKFSAEARAKLSAMRIGKKRPAFSAEHRAAISAGKTGKKPNRVYLPRTAEQNAAMSALKTGTKASDATKAKMSAAQTGRIHSPHTREKLRATKLGKPTGQKGKPIREEVRLARFGRRRPPEVRARIAAGLKATLALAKKRSANIHKPSEIEQQEN